MIILIGLILVLCFAGAWVALALEAKGPQSPPREMPESNQDCWWSHVEVGPDSIEPSESSRDLRS